MVASVLARLAGKGAAKVAKKATKRVPKTKTKKEDQKGLPSVLERKIQKEKTTRDYPDVNLSERVGFKMRTGNNKGNTYEIHGDSIKVYTLLGGDLSGGTAPKYSQKTLPAPNVIYR